MRAPEVVSNFIKSYSNFHKQGELPNIFLFATPRGGSTWFMEMLWVQRGMKYCSEPFNVRRPIIAKDLGISNFADLYAVESEEKIQRYVAAIESNNIRYHNPNPCRSHSNIFTNRIVYKIIHAGMDRIDWFEQTFNAKSLVVIRHPIPVSMSRRVFPLLEEFENSRCADHFSAEQIDAVLKVKAEGDHLSKGVVAWCIHNYFPLSKDRGRRFVLTYEEAVLNASAMVELLADRLELKDREQMLEQSDRPSAVLNLSSEARKKLLQNHSRDRQKLISSWRSAVDDSRERELMRYLELFEIDAYKSGLDVATEGYNLLG